MSTTPVAPLHNGAAPPSPVPARPPGDAAPTAIPAPAATRAPLLDTVAYGLLLAGIYGVIGPLFFMGAKEKIFFAVPAGITKMFSSTFVSSFPGTGVAWVLVGLLEAAVVATLIISLARREFLPRRTKPWLLVTIALSMFAYAVVAFGDTIASEFAGTASLFTYFATSGVLLGLVLLLPPYRPAAWLSSITRR